MPLGAIKIPQLNFQKFEAPNINKFIGGGQFTALTGQRQGLRLQGMQATESKEANSTGMKNLKTKGY